MSGAKLAIGIVFDDGQPVTKHIFAEIFHEAWDASRYQLPLVAVVLKKIVHFGKPVITATYKTLLEEGYDLDRDEFFCI